MDMFKVAFIGKFLRSDLDENFGCIASFYPPDRLGEVMTYSQGSINQYVSFMRLKYHKRSLFSLS